MVRLSLLDLADLLLWKRKICLVINFIINKHVNKIHSFCLALVHIRFNHDIAVTYAVLSSHVCLVHHISDHSIIYVNDHMVICLKWLNYLKSWLKSVVRVIAILFALCFSMLMHSAVLFSRHFVAWVHVI